MGCILHLVCKNPVIHPASAPENIERTIPSTKCPLKAHIADVASPNVKLPSVIQSAMPAVAQAAKDAKIPVYGSSAVMVNDGAFATIAISDTQIGAISADMAYEILAEGKTPADIPGQVVGATDTVINKTTMEAIGVTVDAADGITFVEN